MESINGLKSVCPISVKSRRLSRNNAPRDRYTHAHKQCEKGLFVGRIKYKRKGPFFFTKRTQETGSGLFSLLITICVKGEIVYYN